MIAQTIVNEVLRQQQTGGPIRSLNALGRLAGVKMVHQAVYGNMTVRKADKLCEVLGLVLVRADDMCRPESRGRKALEKADWPVETHRNRAKRKKQERATSQETGAESITNDSATVQAPEADPFAPTT